MDTIAAIATPLGTGAVGIIRISGEKARDIVARIFKPYKIENFSKATPYMMYLGKLVEVADRDAIYSAPLHPYSQALMSAIPVTDPEADRNRIVLQGDIPSPINPPSGCAFCTRCPYAAQMGDLCHTATPELKDMGGGHMVACHMCGQK